MFITGIARAARYGFSEKGSQISALVDARDTVDDVMGIRKSAGSVPTIVCGCPSSRMVCPFGATAPKERRQNASLTITTGGPPGAYSSATNVRPCTGVT